jgi:hypothetical protein
MQRTGVRDTGHTVGGSRRRNAFFPNRVSLNFNSQATAVPSNQEIQNLQNVAVQTRIQFVINEL